MPVKQAKDTINSYLKRVGIEEISLEDAHRRVLAEEVTSILNSPPFERSAMDGYAIRAEDTFGFSETNPAKLKIVDSIGAGQVSNVVVESGEAVKIATGAPIPEGATAVVMEEYTVSDGDLLEVEMSLTPMENIAPMGEDIKAGDVVLREGKVLKPQDLAIIASSGYSRINVFKKPKIGVILLETHDALISTGGTAISKGDVVVDVTDKIGEVKIHGVALRPGKPFGFGIIHEKPVFMLSGYPVAAMVQADVFVRNSLYKMQGIEIEPQSLCKIASRKIPSSLGRTDYIRAKTDGNLVTPLKIKGSGIIRSMVESDSYIIIEENLEGIGEGEKCDVLLYDSLTI